MNELVLKGIKKYTKSINPDLPVILWTVSFSLHPFYVRVVALSMLFVLCKSGKYTAKNRDKKDKKIGTFFSKWAKKWIAKLITDLREKMLILRKNKCSHYF